MCKVYYNNDASYEIVVRHCIFNKTNANCYAYRLLIRRQRTTHYTEQSVKDLLAVWVVGVLRHHVNALENRLPHEVVCRHEPPDPVIYLKDTGSGINMDKSTRHTYDIKRRGRQDAYISPTFEGAAAAASTSSVVSTW